MSRKRSRLAFTEWQRRALADLRAQSKAQPDLVSVGAQEQDADGNIYVEFSVNTADLPVASLHGVSFEPIEEFRLVIYPTDDLPPTVVLPHSRFIGTPHVLSGFALCLYLDVSREWDPNIGINGENGVLNRLWDWMFKASQNDFNADTALFHAVGGVPHITPGTPTIAVRELPEHRARAASAFLDERSQQRMDLHLEPAEGAVSHHVPVFFADSDMPIGAGNSYLGELLTLIRHPRPHGLVAFIKPKQPREFDTAGVLSQSSLACRGYVAGRSPASYASEAGDGTHTTTPDAALFTALAASASRNPNGSAQHLILAVPHPSGGPCHLLALRLAPVVADSLRQLVRTKTTPLIPYEPRKINVATPIQWCYVSDERAAVTTRRDTDRPVTALQGKTVLVLGCGGLGSWIAEFVVRAGAKRVFVSDGGRVTGGLLVRQNYVEDDIGAEKAVALCARLAAISDQAVVEPRGRLSTDGLAELARDVDLIIDATVSLKVAQQLDTIAIRDQRRPHIAQVATDARTGTLGYAAINPPESGLTMTAIDSSFRTRVYADGALERYRYFWEEPELDDELIPTRGCSAPTFHGSAADLAALAGSLVTLISSHLGASAAGLHLIALPHSGVIPGHKYMPV